MVSLLCLHIVHAFLHMHIVHILHVLSVSRVHKLHGRGLTWPFEKRPFSSGLVSTWRSLEWRALVCLSVPRCCRLPPTARRSLKCCWKQIVIFICLLRVLSLQFRQLSSFQLRVKYEHSKKDLFFFLNIPSLATHLPVPVLCGWWEGLEWRSKRSFLAWGDLDLC